MLEWFYDQCFMIFETVWQKFTADIEFPKVFGARLAVFCAMFM